MYNFLHTPLAIVFGICITVFVVKQILKGFAFFLKGVLWLIGAMVFWVLVLIAVPVVLMLIIHSLGIPLIACYIIGGVIFLMLLWYAVKAIIVIFKDFARLYRRAVAK